MILAWLAILLFVKIGSVATVVVLAMMMIHQTLSRYREYYLAHQDVAASAQKVHFCTVGIQCLEFLVDTVLVVSAMWQYTRVKVQVKKSPIRYLLSGGKRHTHCIHH